MLAYFTEFSAMRTGISPREAVYAINLACGKARETLRSKGMFPPRNTSHLK